MPPLYTLPGELVRVSGLSKRYGRLAALDDVAFSVRQGEVLGLIGPNGAGKTTLFECLAGLLPADDGTVSFAGGNRKRSDVLFYVPDAIVPWPEQRLRWVLDFAVGFFGGDPSRLANVVSSLEVETLLDQRVGTLSKGQRKRALLAVGLLTPQPLLLIDEPFDGLDLRQSRQVADTIRRQVVSGRTLFLSIHQIHDAGRVCDRFVLLSGGRVCAEGTAAELAARAADRASGTAPADFEEVFLALA